MNLDLDPECGWCGTPFDQPPWCDHCVEERDNWHVIHVSARQRDRNLDGIEAARQALARARANRKDK